MGLGDLLPPGNAARYPGIVYFDPESLQAEMRRGMRQLALQRCREAAKRVG